MFIKCRCCGLKNFVKNGFVNGGHQRYRCKECFKNFTITDRKYSPEFKLKIIRMYLEGVGMRLIERIEGVSNVMVLYWVRQVGDLIRQKLRNRTVSNDLQDIEILEIDELHHFCQKNSTLCGSGLPLIAIGTKLLILK